MTVDHIIRIYLDSPLYLKFIEFQADHKLGRSYACLLIFIEGMRNLGLIDKDVYAFYKQKYYKPLEACPIVKQIPKCDFCGKDAIGIAVHQTGITKHICERHWKELEKHEKWSVMKNEG